MTRSARPSHGRHEPIAPGPASARRGAAPDGIEPVAVEQDLTDAASRQDPYAFYDTARAVAPIVLTPMGRRLATTYGAVLAVLTHPHLGRAHLDRGFGSDPASNPWLAYDSIHRDSLLSKEGADHTRIKRLVGQAFHFGAIERIRGDITALTTAALDGLEERLRDTGSADLVPALAQPLPLQTICTVLGIPDSEVEAVGRWAADLSAAHEPAGTPQQDAAAQRAADELSAYIEQVAMLRALNPRLDLLSGLAMAREDGAGLSRDELVATVVMLVMSSFDVSGNAVLNGMHSLLETSGEMGRLQRALRRSSSRLDRDHTVHLLVEEMLRHDAAVQVSTRQAFRDTVVAGYRLAEGERVAAVIGAANRDPRVFENPAAFRVGRGVNPHLAFGAGVHACLGASLARLQLQSVVDGLVTRFPRMHVVSARRRPSVSARGFTQLVVAVG